MAAPVSMAAMLHSSVPSGSSSVIDMSAAFESSAPVTSVPMPFPPQGAPIAAPRPPEYNYSAVGPSTSAVASGSARANGHMRAPSQASTADGGSAQPHVTKQSSSPDDGEHSFEHQVGRERLLQVLSNLMEARDMLRRYNYFRDVDRTKPSRGRKSILKLSCIACRELKVKCQAEKEGVPPCNRCRNRGEECVFEKHRRTQKRDTDRIEDIERSFEVVCKAFDELVAGSAKHHLFDLENSNQETKPQLKRPAYLLQDNASTNLPSPSHASGSHPQSIVTHTPPQPVSPPRRKRKTDLGGVQVEGGSSESDDEGGVTLNPLKLLAASASAAGASASGSAERPASPLPTPLPPRWRNTPYQMLDAGAYWRKSHFQPIKDVGSQAPSVVEAGIITEAQARRYLKQFFEGHNNQLRLLDKHLHTYEYLVRNSAFLLGVICSLEARYTDGDEDVALAMRRYIHEKSFPQLLLPPSFKSVEIMQAFIIMTAFGSTSELAQHDRSWTFLFAALRMATELSLHVRPLSRTAPADASEMSIRELRNQERMWLALWTTERILAAQTGRPSLMPKQPYDSESVSDWHTQKYALAEDAVTVALIELEMTVTHHQQLYQNLVADAQQDVSSRLQFYRDAFTSELSKWKTRYALRPTPEQVQALSSASMMLSSLPIRDRRKDLRHLGHLQSRELRNECRLAAMQFVDVCAAQPVEHLRWATNQYLLSAVHAAVMLIQFASRPHSPAMADPSGGQRAIEKVQLFTEKLYLSSRQPMSRSWNSFAATYAQLLQRVLSRTIDVAAAAAAEPRPGSVFMQNRKGSVVLPSPNFSGMRPQLMKRAPAAMQPQASGSMPSFPSADASMPRFDLVPDPGRGLPPASVWGSDLGAQPYMLPGSSSTGSPLTQLPSVSMDGPLNSNGGTPIHAPISPLGWPDSVPQPGAAETTLGGDLAWNDARPLLFDNLMDQLLGASSFIVPNGNSEQMHRYVDQLIFGQQGRNDTPPFAVGSAQPF